MSVARLTQRMCAAEQVVILPDEQIVFTRTLHVDLDAPLQVITDDGEEQIQFPANCELWGYQYAQQHSIDCLRTGAPSETSGPETLKTMEMVFGTYDSAAHGRVHRVGNDLERLT